MAPMKRPAGASIGGAAKKTKGIKVAILATGGYPEDVLTMLAGSLDSIMSTCKEERHRHQQTAADMVSAVLKAALASAEAGVAAAQARLDELKAQKGDRDTTAEAAAATQTSKKETTIAARDAEKRAVEGLKAAKKELAAANEARTTGDTELVEAEAKKTRLEVFLAGPFEEMKAGSLDDARTKEGCSEVLKIGKEYSLVDFDDSLLTSLPSVIQKAPDARGGFDSLCLAQVQELLQQATSDLAAALAAGELAKAERASAVAASEGALAAAEAQEAAGRRAVLEAKREEAEAGEALRAAKAAAKAFDPELREACDALGGAHAALRRLQDDAVAPFTALLEWSNVPPPEPEPEVAEEPAAEPPVGEPAAAAPAA
ncbi:unnamed protein product [Prorocentrum cordatum]|uniref:Uncharacterized protein n=1 Tax=Prorocentrum cordatum TaxID=2364126 RepID=A0ABN9T0J9_9DINO|nr:unnamed protein product [Polarella glacialis]